MVLSRKPFQELVAVHPPSLTKFLTVCPILGPRLSSPSRTCSLVLIVSSGIVIKAETLPATAALTPCTAITVFESDITPNPTPNHTLRNRVRRPPNRVRRRVSQNRYPKPSV
ncbi:hypothetical protein HID58_027023 [Brassica napus]|uniref:Uncharacterized protein n=1 Tax=Brassica napus TaxID=3708 RepID=A0ABQ8CQM0_BRANA|nr:hypothetical protein HID58_027023 [Brassica napus]